MTGNISRKNFRKKPNKNTKKSRQRKTRGGNEAPIEVKSLLKPTHQSNGKVVQSSPPTASSSNWNIFGWISGLFATKEDENMKNAKDNCKNEYNNCIKNAEIKSIESKNTREPISTK